MSITIPVFTAFLNVRKYWCWIRKKAASNKSQLVLHSSIFCISVWKRLTFTRGLYLLSRAVLLCRPHILATGCTGRIPWGMQISYSIAYQYWLGHALFDLPRDSFCHEEMVTPLLKGRGKWDSWKWNDFEVYKTQSSLNGKWPLKYLKSKTL